MCTKPELGYHMPYMNAAWHIVHVPHRSQVAGLTFQPACGLCEPKVVLLANHQLVSGREHTAPNKRKHGSRRKAGRLKNKRAAAKSRSTNRRNHPTPFHERSPAVFLTPLDSGARNRGRQARVAYVSEPTRCRSLSPPLGARAFCFSEHADGGGMSNGSRLKGFS